MVGLVTLKMLKGADTIRISTRNSCGKLEHEGKMDSVDR